MDEGGFCWLEGIETGTLEGVGLSSRESGKYFRFISYISVKGLRLARNFRYI